MKKVSLLCTALLMLAATMAHAGGLNMSWGACTEDGGAANKNFACTSNSGSNVLVCSFEPTLTNNGTTNGNAVIVDLQSASDPLPAWWNVNGAGSACRGNVVTVNSTISPSAVNCFDEFSGGETIGLGGYFITATNKARIKIAGAVPQTNLASTQPGYQYFACNLVISNAKTVPTSTCGGCSTPVCIVLNMIQVTAGGGALDENIVNPLTRNYVTWQGGAGITGGCPAAVPTKNTTWGAVKSLYR